MTISRRRRIELLVQRILDGDGTASPADRRAAFEQDLASAFTTGGSEDQIFEKAVCAAVGQSLRLYDRGLAALDKA